MFLAYSNRKCRALKGLEYMGVGELRLLIQAARIFRAGRLFRLVKLMPQLRGLIQVVISTLPTMWNVTALVLLLPLLGNTFFLSFRCALWLSRSILGLRTMMTM